MAALRRFVKEPDCSVLTVVMSTGGGAAGLTLTVASHVFLLEPNLNPGLEAQAAARVYRLGMLCQHSNSRLCCLLCRHEVEGHAACLVLAGVCVLRCIGWSLCVEMCIIVMLDTVCRRSNKANSHHPPVDRRHHREIYPGSSKEEAADSRTKPDRRAITGG